MSWLEALILGIVQGLTEFLPVSSSGHLELGKALMNINAEKSMSFTIAVHGATVLSTILVFWKDIIALFRGLFHFQWNEETKYIAKILVSTIPVVVAGLLFEDKIEAMFNGDIVFVGIMLWLTACLLAFSYFFKPKIEHEITFKDAFLIGIAQAIAILPGVSRSGSTISTGLLLGNKKESLAKFSFLMVLIPILGANAKKILESFSASEVATTSSTSVSTTAIIVGFIAAFITGLIACKIMIHIVKKGKLIWFAIYCALIGTTAIILGLI